MKIVIVDYGMGNIRSIVSTMKYIGVDDITISAVYDDLKRADKLILPGVGAFGKAMDLIEERNIDKYLQELAIGQKKPLLGICLGMQLLGTSSTEDGFRNGVGLIPGEIRKFDNVRVKVPHVGFNQVIVHKNTRLYDGFPESADFYFTHSFKMNAETDINQSICHYGDDFVASYELDNIAGTQFHPELSQSNGLKLLRNFIEKF